MKRKKGKMKWELYKKIIDEISYENKNAKIWPVFFGEALILKRTKPSIFDMISYAKKMGIREVALNSNGCLLDKASGERLIEAGLDSIHIGIDAFSDETYRKLRVGGEYKKTVQNVLQLLETNGLYGGKLKIRVQFVEMEMNRKEKNGFVDFWLSKGVEIKLRQQLTWSGLLGEKPRKEKAQRHTCYWIMDTMSITDSGDVVTCAADPEGRFIAGNVRTESLKSIWDGKLGELRKMHIEGEWEKLPFPCDICPDWEISYADKLIKPTGEKSLLKKIFAKGI